MRRGSNRGSWAGWKMESSPGKSWDAAVVVDFGLPRPRPSGRDTAAIAATPRPSLARKPRRDWLPDLGSEDSTLTTNTYYDGLDALGYDRASLRLQNNWAVTVPLQLFYLVGRILQLPPPNRLPHRRLPEPCGQLAGPCAPSSWCPGLRGISALCSPDTGS